jgi:TonB family protein
VLWTGKLDWTSKVGVSEVMALLAFLLSLINLWRARQQERMAQQMRLLQAMLCLVVIGVGCAFVGQESNNESAPPAKQELPKRVRVSETVMRVLLIKKVAPEYPEEARKKHVEGNVVMKAIISHEGDVQELTVLSGDSLLVPSALEAAKQWKYKPYLIQGHPVEVETQIMMIFGQ